LTIVRIEWKLEFPKYIKHPQKMSTSTDLRVVVTGHTQDGTSIFTSDTTVQPAHPFGPAAPSFAVLGTQASVPASNNQQSPEPDHLLAGGSPLPRCPPAGVLFSVVTYPPGFSAPAAHRTATRDYGVVVAGEIVLELDGEKQETTLRQGDFLIQGGANHCWRNRSDRDCRVAFVMVSADAVTTAAREELEDTVFGKE
jgi:quercetin dioxygenase-like cupin family protein